MRRWSMRVGAVLAWLGLAVAVVARADDERPMRTATEALSHTGQNARVASGKRFFADSLYAGSERCKGCHESQYRSWQDSWHSKMERWPSAGAVVGDFADRTMQLKNLRVRDAAGKDASISPAVLAFRRGERFFFTLLDRDDASNNQTWEVAKLLGGKWDQGYEVRIGTENFYPAPIRWSVTQNDWIVSGFNPQDWFIADGTPDGRPRKPAELAPSQAAEAKCNGCHTTGFTYAKASDGWWKAQARGDGEIAVACESCHGPGSRHVDEAKAAERAGVRPRPGTWSIVNPLTDLTAEQATQVCGQCHGRGTHKETTELQFPTGFLPGDTDLLARFRLWSYSGTASKSESDYFWSNDWASRNRQQYQDFTKSGHYTKAGMSCITCHAFHGKPEKAQLRSAPAVLCVECHRSDGQATRPNAEMYAGSRKAEAGVDCVDCHMPRVGSRSRATSKSGHQWDATSHVFKVPGPQQELALGIRSACTGCHVDDHGARPQGAVRDGDLSLKQMADDLRTRAESVRQQVRETQALLTRADLSRPDVAALSREAQAKLGFVLADGSKGAHNGHRTKQLLDEAKRAAEAALAASGSVAR